MPQLTRLKKYFQIYSEDKAPFMHKLFAKWSLERPLMGYKVLHYVPLVPNTLLKIACLVASGAEVVVSNPSFMVAHSEAISALSADKITYVEDVTDLTAMDFDFYFDCGAELYQKLGPPKMGAVELTASGDQFYREQPLTFPVVSIDRTLTKQLETLFGSAESAPKAISQLTGLDVSKKSWLIFGFGKIGRGLAYYCVNHQVPVVVADIDSKARLIAESLGIKTINPANENALKMALFQTDIVITATGQKSLLDLYPKTWFEGKVLANMGAVDEFGSQFAKTEVLNNKFPVNFALDEPTPIKYIDPAFYTHNIAVLQILNDHLPNGVNNLSKDRDLTIIEDWCRYHQASKSQMMKWFAA